MPYKVETFTDPLGNEHYLVIDTLFKGISGGGIRIHPNLTLEEVRDLAKNMSYKFAVFNIPVGGAKAGIRLKEEAMKNEALGHLRKFLMPFMKAYSVIPGKDLGITEEQVKSVCKGFFRGEHSIHSSYYTAAGLIACLNFIKSRYKLKDVSVALSGFGRVGYSLVEELNGQGINLLAISNQYGCIYKKEGLDKEELLRMIKKFGNDEWMLHIEQEILAREILYTLPVDILIPGAEAYAINNNNVNHIKAKFICPIANIAYSKDIIPELKRQKIIFFPDFVTNGGGVLGSHFLSWGFSFKETEHLVAAEIEKTLNLLHINSDNNYYELALSQAEDKLKRRKALEEAYERKRVSRMIRNCFIAMKEISPKFLLRNYYKHILKKKFEKYAV